MGTGEECREKKDIPGIAPKGFNPIVTVGVVVFHLAARPWLDTIEETYFVPPRDELEVGPLMIVSNLS